MGEDGKRMRGRRREKDERQEVGLKLRVWGEELFFSLSTLSISLLSTIFGPDVEYSSCLYVRLLYKRTSTYTRQFSGGLVYSSSFSRSLSPNFLSSLSLSHCLTLFFSSCLLMCLRFIISSQEKRKCPMYKKGI